MSVCVLTTVVVGSGVVCRKNEEELKESMKSNEITIGESERKHYTV